MTWAILRRKSYYPVQTQAKLVLALGYVNNLIVREMGIRSFDEFYDPETVSTGSQGENIEVDNIEYVEQSNEWTTFREMVASHMMATCNMAAAGNRGARHQWTSTEDAILVDALLGLEAQHLTAPNGTFRPGYLGALLLDIQTKMPDTTLNTTSIECKVRTLKKQYAAIKEMVGPGGSGFGWNEARQCVDIDKDTFDLWVKSHPNAKGLWSKPFPHYHALSLIFGNDRASGSLNINPTTAAAQSVADREEIRVEEDDLDLNFPEYYVPDTQHLNPTAGQTSMAEDNLQASQTMNITSGNHLGSQSRMSGSKRKKPSQDLELLGALKNLIEKQPNHFQMYMKEWHTQKNEMLNNAMGAALEKIESLTYMNDKDKATLVDLVASDHGKVRTFLQLDERMTQHYCIRILAKDRNEGN